MELKIKLKIIYSVLKELSEGNRAIDEKIYGIEFIEFIDILGFLQNEGLIRNFKTTKYINGTQIGWWDKAEVTMKGIQYLEENSTLAKNYKKIKEVRDWLPL
ncbi:YjcQ family protein [Clostridioides difficile]|uniref:YjcQ family protein n=1 Tax=Clostridioides difficile TaxID=1496 RepID=UPI00115DE526|nr:YjcQ family protein [Clostridioides difficile]TQX27969.1 head protein [Clostridioides difficile]